MRNILLKLSFVGSNYAGWQRQKGIITIQQLVEEAVSKVTQAPATVIGCSRTDAGVHAEDFVANFRTESRIPAERFRPAIQTKLPRDIQVVDSREVAPSFNSRRNSYQKTYRYQIFVGSSPFRIGRWWQIEQSPDIAALTRMAALITGSHDFSGFCVKNSLKSDNGCIIKQAAWRRRGNELYFKITGDRFLHKMVRFLVGSQIEVALGRLQESDFELSLSHPERSRALYPAPPDGLYLMKVKFK